MNIFIDIGLFFGAITLIAYLIVFGIVIFGFVSAYINGRLPIRPQVVNWIFPKPFYVFSRDRQKYIKAEQDPDQALTGEYAAAIGIGGLILTLVIVLLWPIILTLIALRGIREYNTNEQFRSLFDRNPQSKKEHPLKGLD